MGVHYNPFVGLPIKGENFILIDRDGVMNEERIDYVKSVGELVVFEDSLLALRLLREARYRVVVLTNQSPVGRGIIDEGKLREIHEALFKIVEDTGGRIDRFYFCPHKPTDNCPCRKPKPGLFFKSKHDLGIMLEKTYYVGDKDTDILAAQAAGCKSAFVGSDAAMGRKADIIANNLFEAVVKILKKA
jgi:D-glycero-D-manno-heptose 1,7-bisphosphate phosphatase